MGLQFGPQDVGHKFVEARGDGMGDDLSVGIALYFEEIAQQVDVFRFPDAAGEDVFFCQLKTKVKISMFLHVGLLSS